MSSDESEDPDDGSGDSTSTTLRRTNVTLDDLNARLARLRGLRLGPVHVRSSAQAGEPDDFDDVYIESEDPNGERNKVVVTVTDVALLLQALEALFDTRHRIVEEPRSGYLYLLRAEKEGRLVVDAQSRWGSIFTPG